MFAKLTYVVASAALYTQLALGAAVVSRSAQDVFVPPVLTPTTGTVWPIGTTQNVTWDTSNAPQNITNKEGLILLRKAGETTPVILQNNFDILLGSIEITVPWVVDGTDYSIILLGDSGNDSQDFTITGSGISF